MNKLNAFLFVFLAFSAILFVSVLPVKASGDLWVQRAPMPYAEVSFGAVSVNGEIYAIGYNFTYVFNPSFDLWVSKTQMPTHRHGFAIAACQNKIYVIGGWNSTNPNTGIAITLGTNEMYDPATDTWTTRASMPLPTSYMDANVVGDKIYVISGMADIAKPTFSSSNWVYDPLSNSWSTAASIPSPVFSYASAVVGSKIYIVGGDGGNSLAVSNLNQIYDTETNMWTFGQPLPMAVRHEGAGVTTGLLASARLYIVGGTNNGFDGVKTTQIYNPQTDQWTLGAQMSTARLGLAVASVNDSLYALGGESFTGNLQIRGEIYGIIEQYIPLDYQGSIPSPYVPTPPPRSTSTPTPTPTPSPPNSGPTSSPNPFEGLPYDPPIVTVLSPSQNVTYATSDVALNVTVQINGFIYHNVEAIKWLNYSLDGQTAIPMPLIVPSNLSPGYYVYGNDMLTGLSDGTHNLTIYGETAISGLTGNFNASVTFEVDTLTPPTSDSFLTAIVIPVAIVVAVAVAGLSIYLKKSKNA